MDTGIQASPSGGDGGEWKKKEVAINEANVSQKQRALEGLRFAIRPIGCRWQLLQEREGRGKSHLPNKVGL